MPTENTSQIVIETIFSFRRQNFDIFCAVARSVFSLVQMLNQKDVLFVHILSKIACVVLCLLMRQRQPSGVPSTIAIGQSWHVDRLPCSLNQHTQLGISISRGVLKSKKKWKKIRCSRVGDNYHDQSHQLREWIRVWTAPLHYYLCQSYHYKISFRYAYRSLRQCQGSFVVVHLAGVLNYDLLTLNVYNLGPPPVFTNAAAAA